MRTFTKNDMIKCYKIHQDMANKIQPMPNFGDDVLNNQCVISLPTTIPDKIKATHSDRSFSIGTSKALFDVKPNPIHPPTKGIAVDVGCKGNPGKTEFRGVDLETKEVVFHHHIEGDSTNNIGEWLGCVYGLMYAKRKEDKEYIVYSDSMTAISWVRQRKCKTNFRIPNEAQVKMVADAELYLNTCGGRVTKWETRKWGEIPADFNRKSRAKGKRI